MRLRVYTKTYIKYILSNSAFVNKIILTGKIRLNGNLKNTKA